MNPLSPKAPTAFTVIELLVVITILGVLMAVLMPALANARQTATQIQCATKLRSLNQATYAYAQDEQGVLPSFDFKEGHADKSRPRAKKPAQFLHTMDISWRGETTTANTPLSIPGDDRSPWHCPSNDTWINLDTQWTNGAGLSRTTTMTYAYHGNRIELWENLKVIQRTNATSYLKITLLDPTISADLSTLFPRTLDDLSADAIVWKDRAGSANGSVYHVGAGVRYPNHWQGDLETGSLKGANISYGDGRTQWQPPEKIQNRLAMGSSWYAW